MTMCKHQFFDWYESWGTTPTFPKHHQKCGRGNWCQNFDEFSGLKVTLGGTGHSKEP